MSRERPNIRDKGRPVKFKCVEKFRPTGLWHLLFKLGSAVVSFEIVGFFIWWTRFLTWGPRFFKSGFESRLWGTWFLHDWNPPNNSPNFTKGWKSLWAFQCGSTFRVHWCFSCPLCEVFFNETATDHFRCSVYFSCPLLETAAGPLKRSGASKKISTLIAFFASAAWRIFAKRLLTAVVRLTAPARPRRGDSILSPLRRRVK